ncbi:MAG: AbiV family abortive infection protein [Burkholderiales bacterium]
MRGKTIDWKELDKTLRSHSAKLKGLLFFDLLGKGVEPTRKDIKVHRESLSRVDLFNEMKNASLYAGVYQGDLFKPNAVITEKCTTEMLTAARNRLEWYSKVEAITHDHLTELAKCQAYMRLLRILGIADAE